MTAVEWLYSQQIECPLGDWEYFLKKAKEMEKQQIINAFNNGYLCHSKTGEEYYNEKFKK